VFHILTVNWFRECRNFNHNRFTECTKWSYALATNT